MVIVATGVKYLHVKAEEFDIGVYFEANGHGTVLYKEKRLKELYESMKNEEKQRGLKTLLAYLQIANAVIGDAMANLLLVEASLLYLNIGLNQLSKVYSDLPSVTIKATVKDKTLFTPCEDEQRLVKPLEVQEFIDKACEKYELGRAFLRPSGTEDILRVYAEAKTSEMAIALSNEIKDYLKKFE